MRDALLVAALLLMRLAVLMIPIALVGAFGWTLFKRSAVARAMLAHADDREALLRLSEDMTHLQSEIAELQSRLDYAERQLADPLRRDALPAPDTRERTPPELVAALG